MGEEQKELIAALQRFSNKADAVLKIGGSGHATVMVADTTPMWVSVVVVIAALVWGLSKDGAKGEALGSLQSQATMQHQDIIDLRADIRELRATDNAVRAYINTGLLKPKPQEGKQK